MPGRRIASAGLGLAYTTLRRPMSIRSGSIQTPRIATSLPPRRFAHPPLSVRHLASITPQSDPPTPSSIPIPSTSKWSTLLAAAPLVATESTEALAAETSGGGLGGYLAHLLLASPLPSYGLTIIIATLVLRSCITLPLAAWLKRRTQRMITSKTPDVKALADRIAQDIAHIARKEKWTNEKFNAAISAKVTMEYDKVMNPMRNRQWWMNLLPGFINLPIIILFSYAIRSAIALPGSPLAAEQFLWISHLGETDVLLGIVGAGVALTGAEIQGQKSLKLLDEDEAAEAKRKEEVMKRKEEMGRVERAAVEERQKAVRERRERDEVARTAPSPLRPRKGSLQTQTQTQAQRSLSTGRTRPPASTTTTSKPLSKTPKAPAAAAGPPEPRPGLFDRAQDGSSLFRAWALRRVTKAIPRAYTIYILSQLQRIYAVAFLVLASLYVPSGVCLFWLTSMIYTLAQTEIVGYMDRRPKRQIRIKLDGPDEQGKK